MKYVRELLMMVMVLAVAVIAMPADNTAEAKGTAIHGYGKLIKVVDGDTFKLSVDGKIDYYRVAAIDTPETYNNVKAKKDILKCKVSKQVMFDLGKQATAYVKARYLLGDILEYTQVDVGRYGRPIIYVESMIPNLVSVGLARVVDYKNVPKERMDYLYELEAEAKLNNLGMWSALGCWK